MTRTDQFAMLEKLFEAHLGPLREDMREVKELGRSSYKHAEDAHKRIDKYENRAIGWGLGAVVGGGGVGAFLAKYLPSIFS